MANILILEDDLTLSRQMKLTLQQDGHRVTCFHVVADALAYLETKDVTLVIADLFIKTIDGIQPQGGITLISKLRHKANSTVPIIAISGSFSAEISAHTLGTSLAVGATDTLAKPFHPDELMSMVTRLLHLPDTDYR